MRRKNLRLNIWAQIITLPFVVVMILLLVGKIASYDDTNDALNKTQVAETVEKYVIQCYASEGSYPPNLEYLSDHYGLILDTDRYIYFYDIFASNIMPDIQILDNTGEPIVQ